MDVNERRKGTPASESNGNDWGCVPPFHPRRCKAARLYPLFVPIIHASFGDLQPSPTARSPWTRVQQYQSCTTAGSGTFFWSSRTQRSRTNPYPSPTVRMARLDSASDLWCRVPIRGTQPRYVTTANCCSQSLANVKTCNPDPTASAVSPNSSASQFTNGTTGAPASPQSASGATTPEPGLTGSPGHSGYYVHTTSSRCAWRFRSPSIRPRVNPSGALALTFGSRSSPMGNFT